MMVPVGPAEVLSFWSEAGPDKWFAEDESFDQAIRLRFLLGYEAAANGELAAWEESVDGALALVLLLDQFPRNMFRSDARVFATDAQARAVADRALTRGFDEVTDSMLSNRGEASIAIEKARAASRLRALTGEGRNSSRSHCARDGHRFESPQLHHEVAAEQRGRHFRITRRWAIRRRRGWSRRLQIVDKRYLHGIGVLA
jgi:hypothetical protein